jgi:ferredoxin-NADP reductase
MKPVIRIAAACAALAATGAFADHTATHCDNTPQVQGMKARLNTISSQVEKIEWTTDKAERDALINLNMKHLSEAMAQLRKREISTGCQIELMTSMLEALMRQQQVAHLAEAQ